MLEGDRTLTARDVQKTARLSYRQLNDWEARGAVPAHPERGGGWRRFTPREVFALSVCSEIRKRFGVPVERLLYVKEYMLQDGADHFRAAAELMASLGVGVWLMTNLKGTFVLDSELELLDMMNHGLFGGDHESALIFLKVNPLVNRVLACMKDPIQLQTHGRGYEILKEIREKYGLRDTKERHVLQLIRSGNFHRVEIRLKDGKIRSIHPTERVDTAAGDQILKLLADGDYQTVTVTKHDGRIVGVERTVPEKFDN